jgi:DNA-directed RNA polymerase specialized sigma24 family protein
MTDATITTWTYPVDETAVEFCMAGDIALGRLTTVEREVVATRLAGRGLSPSTIARRTHGTLSAVNAALVRARDRARHV